MTDTTVTDRPINYNSDKYRQMLVKLIPAEPLAFYVAILGVVSASDGESWMLWVAFAIGIVTVPLWLYFGQGVKGPLQLTLATLAFMVWDLSLNGGAFASIDGYQIYYGAAALLLFTMVIAPLSTLIVQKFQK